MKLESNPDKYLYKWRYVELGRYWEGRNGESGVTRVQDKSKNPILADPSEVEDFRRQYKNFGLYTSAWVWPTRDIDSSAAWASFYMDLDSDDLTVSHADTKKVAAYLKAFVPEDGLKVYFSGKKGFHIEAESLCLGITPSLQLPEIFRFITSKLTAELDLQSVDTAVLERRRLFRLVNTQHQVSKLFKVQLGPSQLYGPLEDILHYAREPHEIPDEPVRFSVEANQWWRELTYEWENQQETLQDKIRRFERFGTGPRASVKGTTLEFNPRGIFECECNLIGKLWEKAENDSDLTHNERLALCSLLSYTDESIEYLYAILRNCFTAGTTVLTSKGVIPIEDVAVGDYVYTHRNRWRPVTDTQVREAEEHYILRGQGASLHTTLDHRILTKSRAWDGTLRGMEWVEAQDAVGKYWATPMNVNHMLTEPPILRRESGTSSEPKRVIEQSVEFYWLVGYFLGDGCLFQSTTEVDSYNGMDLSVRLRDLPTVLTACQRVGFNPTPVFHRIDKIAHIRLYHKPMMRWIDYNFGANRHSKHLPLWTFSLSKEKREAILDGWIYADGSVLTNKDESITLRGSSITKPLIVGMKLLAQSLGYSTSLFEKENPPTGKIQGRAVNLAPYSYELRVSEFREKGNFMHIDEENALLWSSIRKLIRVEGQVLLYDLTVEEDHSFIADGIAVHNCADFDTGKSNAHIQDWIHRREKGIGGHPVSCQWLQQNGISCGNCDKLERREKLLNVNGELMSTGEVSQPSPVRFLYKRV